MAGNQQRGGGNTGTTGNTRNTGANVNTQSGDRGFGSMSDEEQRRAAQKGGQTSARDQARDEQGQFSGTGSSSRGDQSRDRSGGMSDQRGRDSQQNRSTSGGNQSGGSSR